MSGSARVPWFRLMLESLAVLLSILLARLIEGRRGSSEAGRASITVSTELVGALAVRAFFVQFSAADLEDLLASLDRLVALLEEELSPGGATPFFACRAGPESAWWSTVELERRWLLGGPEGHASWYRSDRDPAWIRRNVRTRNDR